MAGLMDTVRRARRLAAAGELLEVICAKTDCHPMTAAQAIRFVRENRSILPDYDPAVRVELAASGTVASSMED